MNHERIERTLEGIEHELKNAKRSYALARSDERYAPQINNLISSIRSIATDCRVILRTLKVEP
jgi:hypothetical protein